MTRTNALESLVIAGYVRGLSTRDVEASLADALGPEATLSKSTVSRVQIWFGRYSTHSGNGRRTDRPGSGSGSGSGGGRSRSP